MQVLSFYPIFHHNTFQIKIELSIFLQASQLILRVFLTQKGFSGFPGEPAMATLSHPITPTHGHARHRMASAQISIFSNLETLYKFKSNHFMTCIKGQGTGLLET